MNFHSENIKREIFLNASVKSGLNIPRANQDHHIPQIRVRSFICFLLLHLLLFPLLQITSGIILLIGHSSQE